MDKVTDVGYQIRLQVEVNSRGYYVRLLVEITVLDY